MPPIQPSGSGKKRAPPKLCRLPGCKGHNGGSLNNDDPRSGLRRTVAWTIAAALGEAGYIGGITSGGL